ncbi:MAG: nitrogen fixation protein NifQ [Methylococcales bacterium]|nr:nitrogen fixation protein NifQ [Methylococcales bacterium]
MSLSPLNLEQHYQALLACSDSSTNSKLFAQILASWQVGASALPNFLGLTSEQFQQLLAQHFPDYSLSIFPLRKNLDFSRMTEKSELEQFLRGFAVQQSDEMEWVISIIVAACLGDNHLWQDLGLFGREDLSALLKHNFPNMAAQNVYDMKWKKFIYKQLCETEGIYVCRSPSCEYCKDYLNCFGEED